MHFLLTDYLILAVTGAAAGYFGGLLGLGGGVIMVPVLFELLPHIIGPHPQIPQIAVATSLGCVFFTSASSAYAHHGRRFIDWSLAAISAPMSAAGSYLVTLFALRVSGVALKVAFSAFIVIMAVRLWLFDSGKAPLEDRPLRGFTDRSKASAIGLLIGFVGAAFGIGGGSLAVPAFVLGLNKPVHRAVGTATVLGAVTGLVGTIGYLLVIPQEPVPEATGIVIPMAVLLLAAASIPLAQVGARHASSLNPVRLRRLFAITLAVIGIMTVVRALLMSS